MQPEIVVTDPSMKQMMDRFPQHFVNYEAEGVEVNGKKVPKPSAIVPVPLRKSSALTADSAPNVPPSREAVRALAPDANTGAGTGRLKGVK